MSNPKWIDKGKIPIAELTENLPPTQSQNPNTFEIPKFEVSFKFVLQAHIWASTIAFSSSFSKILQIYCYKNLKAIS